MLPELNPEENLRKTGRTEKRQTKANRVTEAIASRDYNNLYITSSFFKDRNKYKAFCAFYAVMRIVDNRIDNLPQSVKQNTESQKRELKVVDAWEQVVISEIFPFQHSFGLIFLKQCAQILWRMSLKLG